MQPFLLEETVVSLGSWAPVVAQFGVAAMVLWYVGERLIPKLMEANREALIAFRDEMKTQRLHDAELTAETHKRLDTLGAEIREMSRSVAAKAA
jgi:hypothetical protein